MKRWVPWAVGASLVGLYFATRKKYEEDQPLTDSEIERLMSEAAETEAFQRLISELVETGGRSSFSPTENLTGPLEVIIELKASGLEKAFAGDITPDAKKEATKIASKLETSCPGAPKLASFTPSIVKVSETPAGFKVRIAWAAVWGSTVKGPVRPEVRDCMEALVKASSEKFKKRFLSLSAQRL